MILSLMDIVRFNVKSVLEKVVLHFVKWKWNQLIQGTFGKGQIFHHYPHWMVSGSVCEITIRFTTDVKHNDMEPSSLI